MSRPSNPQPFAPTGASVQYEAPHGLLKLRGAEQPGTSAYPELDEKGVSCFLQSRLSCQQSLIVSTLSSRTSSPRSNAINMSIGCTNGSNLSEKDSTPKIDRLGDLSTFLLLPSESISLS
jgi:hypothetical protein